MQLRDMPSDDELLAKYAEPSRPSWGALYTRGEWVLKGHGRTGYHRSKAATLALIKMNLLMDRPVDDTASSQFMYEIVRRLVALEEQAAARVGDQ